MRQFAHLLALQCQPDRGVNPRELLLMKWDSGRERHDVPVDMRVALLTAQTHDVKALRGNCAAYCLAKAAHNVLQCQVLARFKITCDRLAVLPWSHKRVPVQVRVLVQKRDRDLVLLDDGRP
jgi:hypothetical protein